MYGMNFIKNVLGKCIIHESESSHNVINYKTFQEEEVPKHFECFKLP